MHLSYKYYKIYIKTSTSHSWFQILNQLNLKIELTNFTRFEVSVLRLLAVHYDYYITMLCFYYQLFIFI